jgi:CHAD domain-containing protein
MARRFSRAIDSGYRHSEPATPPQESPQLAKWLHRVLVELDAVRGQFKPKHVHDLRVALRRCRSAAQGIEQLDPSSAWPRMRKAAKNLLTGLGELRDAQVMKNWLVRLKMGESEAGLRLRAKFHDAENEAIHRAHKALHKTDTKLWHKWTSQLPERAERIRCGSPAAELFVLQRWHDAWDRYRYATRTRSKTALHQVRIGIKRFRYSVEIFLPGRYARWGGELKKLQDLLGEIHDLDVLWAAICGLRPALSSTERAKWKAVIETERVQRLAVCRGKMRGAKPVWDVWRAGLPKGLGLEAARLEWLGIWASYLDPDAEHSRKVMELATQLYDGILAAGVPVILPHGAKNLLAAAAIVHDVGRAQGQRHHQKKSFKLISEREPPPGWTRAQMGLVAAVARYHRGGLPHAGQKSWAAISADDQGSVLFLAGVLRLAVALVSDPGTLIGELHVGESEGAIQILVEGYEGQEPLASELAVARHLLENALHRAILIEPARRKERLEAVASD